MALLRGDVERIKAVARLDPGRLHIRDLEDLAHDLGVALLGGDVQRRLAVLVLLGRHLGDQRPVEVREDPLGVGHAARPRREVERRVAALPWAVPAPPLQGHDAPEALLLLHPPEALELLQRAQPDAGLPFHGRIRWDKASDCDASFLTNPKTFASPNSMRLFNKLPPNIAASPDTGNKQKKKPFAFTPAVTQ